MSREANIKQDKQWIPNKKSPIHVVSALNHMKTIWGWEDQEMKDGAIGFLDKVLGNIRRNPDNAKMRDLNITKIRKLTKRWRSIPMLVLFNAGFQEDMLKGGRMTLNLRDMAQFNEVCDLLENCKKFDPTKEPEKPAPKKKVEKPATPEVAADAMEVEENKTNDDAVAKEGTDNAEAPQTDEEMAKKLQQAEYSGKGNDAMEEDVEAWDDDMDDLLARIKAEKKAKGLDTLNMKELAGLSKEEKIKLLEEKRAKFRAQKDKNAMQDKIEQARKQREAVKAQAEMQRRREEHENKMAIQFKKKQKEDNKRRKAAAREKIRKQKEQRRKEREAREKAKREAAANNS